MSRAAFAREDVTIATGDVLGNGWVVVDMWFDRSQEKFGDMRPQGFVLAMSHGSKITGYDDRYATWSFVRDERGIVTIAGNYFNSVYSAARDFGRRIGTREEV